MVLKPNKYKKFRKNFKAMLDLMWVRSKFWIALKSTTDVASFTTPSPNTRLYKKGVSSWWRICIIVNQDSDTWCIGKKIWSLQERRVRRPLQYLQCANRIRGWKYCSNCCNLWGNFSSKINWKKKLNQAHIYTKIISYVKRTDLHLLENVTCT